MRNDSCRWNARAKAEPLDYFQLAPILNAGYASSLDDAQEETTHFAVLKTREDFLRIRKLLAPFLSGWHGAHPARTPTIIVVAGKTGKGLCCLRAMEKMEDAARQAGLLCRISIPGFSGENARAVLTRELAIPDSFSVTGIIGFAS